MNTAIIGINYTEGKHRSFKSMNYQGVYCSYRNKGGRRITKTINTGNFVRDWFWLTKFIVDKSFDHVSGSSSCDHFFMDGAPFDSAYLHYVKDEPVLKYAPERPKGEFKNEAEKHRYLTALWEVSEGHLELFVPQGTRPTFEVYKKYCKGEINRFPKVKTPQPC